MAFCFFVGPLWEHYRPNPRTFSTTARMPLILFWAEVEEEEEDDDENSIFPGLMKMEEEEEEESSLFSGLMKMESDEEE